MVKNLKLIRNNRGISQQTLANTIGTTQQSINMYENHKIEPDINTLISLADYFDVTVDYLIGRTDENNQPLSDSNSILSKYSKLNKSEKICIDTLIDTYINLKKRVFRNERLILNCRGYSRMTRLIYKRSIRESTLRIYTTFFAKTIFG